eukprot:m.316039 g.316039  ORF g.316039 m.316039 type:complete len:118 (-) comp20284_c0_seq6:2014-2367(-)
MSKMKSNALPMVVQLGLNGCVSVKSCPDASSKLTYWEDTDAAPSPAVQKMLTAFQGYTDLAFPQEMCLAALENRLRELVQLSRVVSAARGTVNTRWQPPPGVTMADMDLLNAVVEAQ